MPITPLKQSLPTTGLTNCFFHLTECLGCRWSNGCACLSSTLCVVMKPDFAECRPVCTFANHLHDRNTDEMVFLIKNIKVTFNSHFSTNSLVHLWQEFVISLLLLEYVYLGYFWCVIYNLQISYQDHKFPSSTCTVDYLEDCYGNRLPVATGYHSISASAGMRGASGREERKTSAQQRVRSARLSQQTHWNTHCEPFSVEKRRAQRSARSCPLVLVAVSVKRVRKQRRRICRNGEPPLTEIPELPR